LIHEQAFKGDFLGADHTLRHVREAWQPRLIDRHNYDQWKARGGSSMGERARMKIDEILSAEPGQILSTDVEVRIRTMTERAMAAQMM
jgi:trimethylamine--corrinoid protein Co-methyltransferase